jgi:hypothetical protein
MAAQVGDVFNYPGTESGESPYRNRGGWHIHIVVKVGQDANLVHNLTALHVYPRVPLDCAPDESAAG